MRGPLEHRFSGIFFITTTADEGKPLRLSGALQLDRLARIRRYGSYPNVKNDRSLPSSASSNAKGKIRQEQAVAMHGSFSRAALYVFSWC